MKIVNTIFPYRDFLYLLQLEEYETKRYLRLIPRFFLRRNFQKRKSLDMTARARATFILSIFITILGTLVSSIFTLLLIPIWIVLVNIALTPVFDYFKSRLQKKAAQYFKNNFQGRVIGIAGSYGKTTTKNYIYELVRFNYKTQMVPGNINTPTGVADWVLKNLKDDSEILIVEMDTYFVGEIARTCKVTPPDIAILTNVGDQHLERLGTKKNLKKALEEVFEYAKPNAIKIDGKKSNLDYALEVAKVLNIPEDIVKDTTDKLERPDRRGDVKIMHGFNVIDESYNISFSTAKAALERAIEKTGNKKLVVITAGIPELGVENADANVKYGELLKKSKADIILLKSILHSEVAKNIEDYKNLHIVDDFTKAWEYIKKTYDPQKTLVLMMPELGDQYY